MVNADQIVHKQDEILRKQDEMLSMGDQMKTMAGQLHELSGAVSQVEKRFAGLEKMVGDTASAVHDMRRNSVLKDDLKSVHDGVSAILDLVKRESHNLQTNTDRLRGIEHDIGRIH